MRAFRPKGCKIWGKSISTFSFGNIIEILQNSYKCQMLPNGFQVINLKYFCYLNRLLKYDYFLLPYLYDVTTFTVTLRLKSTE